MRAILNDHADSRAKEEWQVTSRCDQWTQQLGPSSLCVHIEGRHIAGNLDIVIRHHIRRRRLRTYWAAKGQPNDNIAYDTAAVHRAGKTASRRKRQWVAKFTTGQIATGRHMKRCQFWAHDRCPCCQAPNEDTTHVLKCPSDATKAHRTTALEKLSTALQRGFTNPDIHSALIRGIDEWTANRDITVTHVSPAIAAALQAQTRLGWEALLKGQMAPHWEPIQRDFLSNSRYRRRCQIDWSKKVVQALWDYSSSLWHFRNAVLHDGSGGGDNRPNEEFLNQCIRNEWFVGPQRLHMIDRALFQGTTLQQVLDQSLTYRQQWLRSAALARIASLDSQTQNVDEDSRVTTPSHPQRATDTPSAHPRMPGVALP